MNPDAGSNVSGVVKFIQVGDTIRINGVFKNLPAGKHGFHVHEFGNLL